MDNLDTFIKKLNEDKVFKTLKALNKELNEDADFISKIQKYKLDTNNIDLKKEILNDKRYLKYKDLENKVYLFSLKLNQKLKELKTENSSFTCHRL